MRHIVWQLKDTRYNLNLDVPQFDHMRIADGHHQRVLPRSRVLGYTQSVAVLDNLTIAKLAVSLGGTETLASHPAAMTHLSVPDERKAALGITDNLVRISIGIEDPDDLIADFDQALAKV